MLPQGHTKYQGVNGVNGFHVVALMLYPSCAYLHPLTAMGFPEGVPTSYSAKFSHENGENWIKKVQEQI